MISEQRIQELAEIALAQLGRLNLAIAIPATREALRTAAREAALAENEACAVAAENTPTVLCHNGDVFSERVAKSIRVRREGIK